MTHGLTEQHDDSERRAQGAPQRVVCSACVALAFYVAFIVMSVSRA